MKILKLIAATAMVTVLGVGMASASTVGVITSGSSAGGPNDSLVPLGLGTTTGGETSLSGLFGAQLWVTGNARVTATLMGADANYTNSFRLGTGANNTLTDAGGHFNGVDGTDDFNPAGLNGTEGYSTITVAVTAGLLDFSFMTTGEGGATVTNGSNPDNTAPVVNPGINFFVYLESSTVAWLFFDDDGNSNDDNHDDLVIRLAIVSPQGGISPIPVPAAGFLLLGALGGLAALRRRKRKAS